VEDVFNGMASTIPAFKGMSYMRIGSRGMMVAAKTPTAVPQV
jgi:hypothetical protein